MIRNLYLGNLDLGIPPGRELVDAYMGEHGHHLYIQPRHPRTIVDDCPVWPSDDELAANRAHIGQPVDPYKSSEGGW